jgi:CDP-glucose 4,6-dehydratase
VLITGHTGFKGGWLSLWLKGLEARVTGYSLEPPTKPSLFESIGLADKVTHVIGDIRDEHNLVSTFEKYKPEFVFHLAAQPLVRLSYREPKLTYETNIMGTVNVLEAVRKTSSVKVCIIITSDKCYENRESLHAYREIDALGGYDPYSSSKGCAELVINAYRRSFFNGHGKAHGIALSSARAGNVIGGGDWGEDRIIPDSVRALSEGKAIAIRNPSAIRPWQYVLEPLFGYLLLGAKMAEDGIKYSGAWNFGPENDSLITVKDLVELVIKRWGSGTFTSDTSEHPHEAQYLKLDISKARSLLGWKPLYDVNESIERTIGWYKDYYTGMKKTELRGLAESEILNYTKRVGQEHNVQK